MSDRPPERGALRLLRPLAEFLSVEAAGGIVLVAAIAGALLWANLAGHSYEELWTATFTVGFPDHHLTLTLREWVNEGLMTVFFFVVGLEIKRELVEGELREPRKAMMPVVAAIGGMIVPALIYLALNAHEAGERGWAIPMATDIAIAVGIVSLLGRRVSPQLKLFLLALAIVDDIGAILVIAIFYSTGIAWEELLGAAAVLGSMILLRRLGIWSILAYVVLGIGVWVLVRQSGVHATIAGVLIGLLTPARPLRQPELVDPEQLSDLSSIERAYETVVLARESVSVVEWLEHRLHPLSSYVIVPVFALANAGVVITSKSLDRAVTSPVTHGIVLGLVVGKLVGISGFAWLAHRLRIAVLPSGSAWPQLFGVAALGGIGFTVSLFVANLAFGERGRLADSAKISVLAASLVAAVTGALLVWLTTRNRARESGPGR